MQPRFTGIEGVILGTPDIYKVKGDILYVTDWKTKDTNNDRPLSRESFWMPQMKLYAYMTLVREDLIGIVKKVILKSELYHRQEWVKDSLEVVRFWEEEYDTLTLIKHAQILLEGKLHLKENGLMIQSP